MDWSYLTPKRVSLRVRVFFLKREYDRNVDRQKKQYEELLNNMQLFIVTLEEAMLDSKTFNQPEIRTFFDLTTETKMLRDELIDVCTISDLAERETELQHILRVQQENVRQFLDIRSKDR